MCDSETPEIDLATLLFLCENYAARGSAVSSALSHIKAGRVKDCSDEGVVGAADWLLVALLALGSKLPISHPLMREIETLADAAEAELEARGLDQP